MSDLQISLPEPMYQFAGAQIASGRFSTMDEYLQALVSADLQSQQFIKELAGNQKLESLLEEGLESPPGREWSNSVLTELKQRLSHDGNPDCSEI